MEEKDIFDLDEQAKQLSEAEKRVRDKELSDIRLILKKPEGRRFCWKLLGSCGIFRNSFSANSNQTAFAEGIRNVGLVLLRDINEADITAFAQMQNEHLSALKSKKEAKT